MSKLIDSLERVGQHAPASLGFGATSRSASPHPDIMLIGQTAAGTLLNDRSVLEAPVDAVMVLVDDWRKRSLDRIRSALKNRLWGVRADGIGESQAKDLRDRGCDFVVFGVDDTAAAVLNDDELGKIIAIDSELGGREARAIQGLPIDAVLLEPGDTLVPLTVRKLADIEQARQRIDKPFLVATSSELGAADLEVVRNAGIPALVVDLAAGDAIGRIKEAVTSLPRRTSSSSRSSSRNAAVPQAPVGVEDPSEEFGLLANGRGQACL